MKRFSLTSLRSSFRKYFEPEDSEEKKVEPDVIQPNVEASNRRRSQSLGHHPPTIAADLPSDSRSGRSSLKLETGVHQRSSRSISSL